MVLTSRVANLAFFKPNMSILAFLYAVWIWKNSLAFWLNFGFFMSKKTIYILNFPISIIWGNGFQEVGNLHPSTEIFFIATRHHFKSIV